MNITTFGLDIAKNVMQVHWVDEQTGEVGRRALKRSQLAPFFARQAQCRIVLEACGSGHYWGRTLSALGHEVRLIHARHVRPFVRGNKNDAADAQAIWSAAQQPDMRWVPLKSEEQQAVLSLHRVRAQWIKVRTQTVNGLRGLLYEFAACLGLVPCHRGTGGKVAIGHLSKRGDPYLRTLLMHGARAVIFHAKVKSVWLEKLLARRPLNVVVAALANKMARTAWALIAHGREYQAGGFAKASSPNT